MVRRHAHNCKPLTSIDDVRFQNSSEQVGNGILIIAGRVSKIIDASLSVISRAEMFARVRCAA